MWRLVLTVSLLCWSSEGQVTCRNNSNGEVDWFILYKEPKLKTGLEYIYIDSATKWPPPVYKNIKDPKGVLANTLRPFFKPIRSMDKNFGFISYSDQPPGSNANHKKFGHSKGVVMVEKDKTGVWLLHSTPQFPFRRDENKFWPDSGETNAQMFICVTFPYDEFKKIGKHLQYIGAFPFEHDIPDSFHQELKDAANWVQIDIPPNTPMFQELKSNGKKTFRSFAKRQLKKQEKPEVGDLYYTIAKELDSNVYVQYWNCKEDDSYCDFKVSNVVTKKTPLGTWETSDHSKWCVAKDQNKHWSCVADMNRAVSQYKRRGGALCIENEDVQQIFLNFVKDSEDCPPTKKRRTNDCESDMSCSCY